MAKIKRIDHIGILVEDIDTSVGFWRDALGLELDHISNVPAEGASVAFFPTGGSEIELVQPTAPDTGLARALEKRGPGVHHICLEVDDIEGMLADLKEKGVQLINEQPRISEDGKKYAFIHPKSGYGVLVELYELPK